MCEKEKQIKLIYTGENQLSLLDIYTLKNQQLPHPHTYSDRRILSHFLFLLYHRKYKIYKLPNKHMCNALISVNNA